MALKIVTGGTTGAADGTLVSSGNPLVIVALNTAVDAHIRCDDGYWSNDQSFDVPAQLEVSFDGGSTWYDNADEPITAPEIYAVNVPIKIRQTVAAGSTSGSFTTDGTYTAIAALSTPTLTCTVVDGTQIDLSWTNVSNEDASPGYTIERGTDGVNYSALTTKAQNVTTHSDTGLTTGQHYYYRVKAEGSGRYSDSGWGTDDDTPVYSPFATDDFTGSDGANVDGTSLDTGGTWTEHGTYAAGSTTFQSNRARQSATTHLIYASTAAPAANYSVQALLTTRGGGSGGVAGVVGRVASGAATFYLADYYDHATAGSRTWRLYKFVAGAATSLGTYTQNLGASATATVKLEMNGTAIKLYVDGVERISATDSAITAAGYAGIYGGAASSPSTNSVDIDDFTARRI